MDNSKSTTSTTPKRSPTRSQGALAIAKAKARAKAQAKRFALTLEGATEEQLAAAKEFFGSWEDCTLAILARESGQHANHPHFQGYFELSKRMKVQERLREVFGDYFHVEPACGTQTANIRYVYGMNKPYEIGLVVYHKGPIEVPKDFDSEEADLMGNFVPHPFQQFVLDLLKGPKNSRTIYWFYDFEGNVGKTVLGRYLHRFYGAVSLGAVDRDTYCALARVRDLSGMDPKIVIFDLCRSYFDEDSSRKQLRHQRNRLMTVIEKIKDQLFFSGKYESSSICLGSSPIVIVFANSPPYRDPAGSGFSEDRWKVYEIPKDRGTPIPRSREDIVTFWNNQMEEWETIRKELSSIDRKDRR